MAQETSTTSTVTSKNGKVHTNLPVNPQNVVTADKGESLFFGDGRDKNKYPTIRIEASDDGTFYWFYDLGDEATRDADFTNLDNSINPQ